MNQVIRKTRLVVLAAVMASLAALSANAEQRPMRRTLSRSVIDVIARRDDQFRRVRFEGRVERLDRRHGMFLLSTRQGVLGVEGSRRDVDRLRNGDRVVVTGVLDRAGVLIAERIDFSRNGRSWERGDHRRGHHHDEGDDDDDDDEGDGD